MKSDLIITRFKTEPLIGTKSIIDPKTFFGSKMIDIENDITIDNSIIQYSELFDSLIPINNGYQYYNDIDNLEKIYLINLSDVKLNQHSISLLPQSKVDLQNNTNWLIKIYWKDLLTDYLFYKLKEVRTFKCISYTDILDENINFYIRKYITTNLVNRYKFSSLNLYVEYVSLSDNNINVKPNLQFDPKFTIDVKSDNNLMGNVNKVLYDTYINVNYSQTQSSQHYKFNYYFDLMLTKI